VNLMENRFTSATQAGRYRRTAVAAAWLIWRSTSSFSNTKSLASSEWAMHLCSILPSTRLRLKGGYLMRHVKGNAPRLKSQIHFISRVMVSNHQFLHSPLVAMRITCRGSRSVFWKVLEKGRAGGFGEQQVLDSKAGFLHRPNLIVSSWGMYVLR